jgi:hypothetical protein
MTDEPSPRLWLDRGELICAASAAILLVLMFGFEWYGVAGLPGSSATRAAVSTAKDGWHGLTVLRWLILVTALAALGSAVLHLSQHAHGNPTETGLPLTVLGALTATLVSYRVLISLPSPNEVVDQKLGAVLAVLASFGVAFGGFELLREERSRARRLEQRSRGRLARAARAR